MTNTQPLIRLDDVSKVFPGDKYSAGESARPLFTLTN